MIVINDLIVVQELKKVIQFIQNRYTYVSPDLSLSTYLSNELNYRLPEDISKMFVNYNHRYYFYNGFIFFEGSSWQMRYIDSYTLQRDILYASNRLGDFNDN
jgi:hypothetical protein